jgi:hypothetical protein
MPRLSHETIKLRVIYIGLQIGCLAFDIRQNLLCEIKIIKELSQLYNHRITTYITCFKQANYDMFELQPLNKK